jgi:hypothetical protein
MDTPPVPSVLAMLLCDQIIIDAQTQKKSLIGIFDSFNAVVFPASANIAVYAKLADAEGQYGFKIRIVHLRDERLIGEVSTEGMIQTRLEPADVAVYFVGFSVPEPGKYEFQLFANDAYLTRITMEARQIGVPPTWQQPQQP